MEQSRNRFSQALLWLMPNGIELAFYFFIAGIVFAASSMDAVRNLFFVSGDFNPISSAIESIDVLLQHVVGEKIAGSISLGIFWAVVGLIVNLLWWLGSNFSTELNNDLVFSRYIHPRDTDPNSQLKLFIEKSIVRTVVAIIGIIYLNYFLSQAQPRITTKFADIIATWSINPQLSSAIWTFLTEILMLHIFVILARLVLLRKQIFNS